MIIFFLGKPLDRFIRCTVLRIDAQEHFFSGAPLRLKYTAEKEQLCLVLSSILGLIAKVAEVAR